MPWRLPRMWQVLLLACAGDFTQYAVDSILLAAEDADVSYAAASVEFFEKKVRPVFAEHCHNCHSSQADMPRGGLLLDSRRSILQGGTSGAAIVPGDASSSLIMSAVRHEGYEMPPEYQLSAEIIGDLEEWIRIGAPWPSEPFAGAAGHDQGDTEIDIAAGRTFWSFQPLTESKPPKVYQTDWPRSRIDRFVLARLEQAGMQPAAQAHKQTLIRRLYVDLIGLPPTYADVAAFARNGSADAYESLVDELLASPHYGERWARYWLDLVRYAEDHTPGVPPPRYAYRYRDWVIRAFNDDLPYDEFLRRQLAADFVADLPPGERAALGLLGLSPTYFKGPKQTKEVLATILADEWEERIDVITRTFLGLTVACARCHDHKYDPITTADYYALAGVLANTHLVEAPIVDLFDEDAAYISALTEELLQHESRYSQRMKQRVGLKKENAPDVYRYDKEILESASEIQRIKALLPEDYDKIPRTNAVQDAASWIDDQSYVVRELFSPEARFWTTVQYETGRVRDIRIHIRGNVTQLGPVAPRRFLEVLSQEGPAKLFRNGSGRLELAESIVNDATALTGRVIVNRVWGWHFGNSLVRTPSNFGKLGDPPSHPALLDDLTNRFITQGWSLKELHREIVVSSTYRQASDLIESYARTDPENRLLWRMNRRRQEIEQWRDAALQVSGGLRNEMGGPSTNLDDVAMDRRTIYGRVSRQKLASLLGLFDYPEPTRHSPERNVTTTPLQQLYFLNGSFVRAQSARVVSTLVPSSSEIDAQIQFLFRQVLSRDPSPEEAMMARTLIAESGDLEFRDRWSMLVQALLVSNEFLFVD